MFNKIIRIREQDAIHPVAPVFAGIALMTLPVLRLLADSAQPVTTGYWVSLFLGALLVTYGSTLRHRLKSIPRRAGDDDAS